MTEWTKMNQELRRKSCQTLPKVADPIQRFRLLVLKTGCGGVKNIARKFRMWDLNNDKKITWDEFKRSSMDIGIDNMSENDLKKVFCHFDQDASGYIDREEFLSTMRPHMNEARRTLAKRAFAQMDRTGDGLITIHDLIDNYDVSKHPKYVNGDMSKRDVYMEFLRSFDVDDHYRGKDEEDESPVITLEEWMDFYCGVSASVDDDAFFNLMIRNSWRLEI
ncbi:calcyphosin-like protein [Babylonia areolata]|uniref:calcyphosin-like protein n=1 Tax=Babylonia areolata TaxID=304850 RepID=UPI003FD53CEC